MESPFKTYTFASRSIQIAAWWNAWAINTGVATLTGQQPGDTLPQPKVKLRAALLKPSQTKTQ
jgi:hypothetical protein